jgi:hypothetical protein
VSGTHTDRSRAVSMEPDTQALEPDTLLLGNTNTENLSSCPSQDACRKTFFWILRRRDSEGGS